eukprot:CAMPEP_0177760614 /NCGR_PEP_ID=MMETSP0491_2-20121128/5358_1 /TAXON_ID=63592 /ORGANISM="Tetraselmis chuii, Strain PLY429" /LENGTH=311 /DNA_ID=CAMNT_0019276519 /DNA_START=172 /DNA_END=1107 /DNA_ORIENTATION=+
MLRTSAGRCRIFGWRCGSHLPPPSASASALMAPCPRLRSRAPVLLVAVTRGAVTAANLQTPLKERALLRELCPKFQVNIVGVSFDGRQDAVKELEQRQPVALVKEPDNKFDASAVRVETLCGKQLGYIPRDTTCNIKHDTCFGHVLSMGPNAKGLFGASILVRPTLPPLTLEMFPPNLPPTASNLSSYISEAACERLRMQTCKAAEYRCTITGARGTEYIELWEWDAASATIALRGLTCVHPEIAAAKRIPQLSTKESTEAVRLLRGVNQWKVRDCKAYFASVQMQYMMMYSNQTWSVDVSWLSSQGVDYR